ncbi:MAG TPA: DUF2065 domain-containing protein [Rubrivivax sp.]|nr:DUF2065 domain-containing protein [Rubrivivax sp.]
MSDLLFGAIALMLVLEGLLPFLSPQRWRAVFQKATQLSDGQIRFVGLSSMVVGVVLLLFYWN